RVDLDPEAAGEGGEEDELVLARRSDRPPLALRPAFEVHRRPVALEVARARDDEVRPERSLGLEHRSREDEPRPLGGVADCRASGGLVAGDDESAYLSLGDGARVSPGRGDAAPVRGARNEVDGRLAAEGLRESERMGASARVVLGPDDGDVFGLVE